MIFSHATGYMCNDTNFNNYFGRTYQARYLAGVAAGLKSLETGNNNLGYVAAYGHQYAETCSGINGFTLGVQAVNPDATVYVKELGAWADEVNEAAFAKELIQILQLRRHLPALRLRPAPDRRPGCRRVRLRLQLRHDCRRPQRPPDCRHLALERVLPHRHRGRHELRWRRLQFDTRWAAVPTTAAWPRTSWTCPP